MHTLATHLTNTFPPRSFLSRWSGLWFHDLNADYKRPPGLARIWTEMKAGLRGYWCLQHAMRVVKSPLLCCVTALPSHHTQTRLPQEQNKFIIHRQAHTHFFLKTINLTSIASPVCISTTILHLETAEWDQLVNQNQIQNSSKSLAIVHGP